jgi:crotonobetainyl-CoA:carnitine CoA-transferase CaiB-like acyl-CoA transferase
MGSEHPNIVPYGSVFTSKDGLPLVLAIGDDRQFRKLCAVLGAPDLAENPDFSTNKARVRNRATINAKLNELIERQGREYLLEELHRLHVPAGAVNSVAEVFEQPQAKQMCLQADGAIAGVRQVAFKGAGTGIASMLPPPAYAQDTRQVLQKLAGLTPEELAALTQAAGIASSKTS